LLYFTTDTVRELLSHVPASLKSQLPSSPIHTIASELVGEYDLTPLHLAAYSGSEDVVRVLLNSSGVDVEDKSTPSVRQYYIRSHKSSLSEIYAKQKQSKSQIRILIRMTFA
jgi:ankyrin repeat protein